MNVDLILMRRAIELKKMTFVAKSKDHKQKGYGNKI